jgi:hypothetical protein
LLEIRDAVDQALQELYYNDKYLISNRPRDGGEDANHVSERGIVFRFGIYLYNLCSAKRPLRFYDIDAEYNRNMYDKKNLPSFPNGTYPDLIVHKRGGNEDNLLVVEFKTWWNNDRTNDEKRIKEFMAQDGEYRYKLGLSVLLKMEAAELGWFTHSPIGIVKCKHTMKLETRA